MYKGIIGLFAVVIFSFSTSLCFSEDTTMFYPSSHSGKNISTEDFVMQSLIKTTANEIKRDMFDMIYACQAVRENDFSYCDKSKDKRECISDAKWFLDLKEFAEGSCKGLTDFPLNICKACSQGDYGSLKGKEIDVCNAFSKRDANLLYKAGRDVLGLGDLAEAEESLNIYYGFKHYSESACDRFASPFKDGSYEKKMECRVLFGSGDSRTLIDRIALDLAYLRYVKELKGNISACDNIEDGTIKKACKSSAVKDLQSFLMP